LDLAIKRKIKSIDFLLRRSRITTEARSSERKLRGRYFKQEPNFFDRETASKGYCGGGQRAGAEACRKNFRA